MLLLLGSCCSGSARRSADEICILFAWFQTADIDEKSIRREDPDDLVMVLAEAKVGTDFPAFFFLLGERLWVAVLH